MVLRDVSSIEKNPAVRLVHGSPILNSIHHSEGIFTKKQLNIRSRKMVESPLFTPKKNSIISDQAIPQSDHGTEIDLEKQISYSGQTEPYENVIISAYNPHFYTPKPVHMNHNGHQYNLLVDQARQSRPPTSTRASSKRGHKDPYENLEHVQYNQFRRPITRYVPHRAAPRPPHPPSRSPADTSGYSSYEQNTLSLGRGVASPPPSFLPVMSEENFLQTPPPLPVPGYPVLTVEQPSNYHPSNTFLPPQTMASHQQTLQSRNPNTLTSHHKFMMDQAIFRQYFCIALTTCIVCPPCGYWSLYQAFKVDDMIDRDNFLGAERLARKIKRYSIIIMIAGVFWVSLTVVIFFVLLNKFKE